MVNMRSGPVTFKVQVYAMVLNEQMDHMKAANLQTVHKQRVPGSLTAFPTEPEPVGYSSPSSVEGTSESEMDTSDVAALMPLPPEDKNEFLPRSSGRK
eukprot:g45925.t1